MQVILTNMFFLIPQVINGSAPRELVISIWIDERLIHAAVELRSYLNLSSNKRFRGILPWAPIEELAEVLSS